MPCPYGFVIDPFIQQRTTDHQQLTTMRNTLFIVALLGFVVLAGCRGSVSEEPPVHLNPNVRRTVFPILERHERIHLLEPLPYDAFVEAIWDREETMAVSDSGVRTVSPVRS